MTRRREALLLGLGDGEAHGAAGDGVDVVGVAADDVLGGTGPLRRHADADALGLGAGRLDEGVRGGPAGRLDDDPVRPDVDVPDGRLRGADPAGRLVEVVLEGEQAAEGGGDHGCLGALGADRGYVGGVRGGDREAGGGPAGHPCPGEARAQRVVQAAGPGARLRLVGQAGGGLPGREAQVALEGTQHLRRGVLGADRAGGGCGPRGVRRPRGRDRGDGRQDEGADSGQGGAASAGGGSGDHAECLLGKGSDDPRPCPWCARRCRRQGGLAASGDGRGCHVQYTEHDGRNRSGPQFGAVMKDWMAVAAAPRAHSSKGSGLVRTSHCAAEPNAAAVNASRICSANRS